MNQQPEPQEGALLREVHLRDYWKVLWQGRYTFLAVFILVLAVTAVYTFTRTPIYKSTATVIVEARARSLTPGEDMSGMGAGSYGWWAEEKYHNTQMEIVRSRDVAQRAFDALGLANDERFEEAKDPVEAFRGMIQVDQRRKTGLLEVSMFGTDAEETTRWVNAVADAYVQRNIDEAQSNVRVTVDTIRGEMEALQTELSDSEDEVVSTLRTQGIFDPDAEREVLRSSIRQYDTELTAAKIESERLLGRLNSIRESQNANQNPMNIVELASNVQIQELNKKKEEIKRDLEKAKVTLRPGHPEYESLESQMNAVDNDIRDAVSQVMANIRDEYRAAEDKAQLLRRQKLQAENDLFRVNQASGRVNLVKTDAETKRQIFDMLTKSLNEVELTSGLMNNNVSVLDRATPPLYAVKPVKRVNLAIGGMLGVLLGLTVVFFLDYLDNTIRNPQDIEDYLQLSVLGVIPKINDDESASRAVKEAYQSLRTSIIFSSKNRTRKVILVTSTSPQEGKSSTIANLGRVLATSGDRVIVLDCDLRRPTQHVHHEVERDTGITNYLSAPKDEDNYMPYTQRLAENLDLLPSGPIPPSPPELLGSERFAELIDKLREHYDWVLIDSPPSATLADSTLLAQLSDMVILVVRHNQADKDLVLRNVQHLRARNALVVGAVLNNVDMDKVANKDYYYTGYYYLSDDGTKKRTKKRRPTPKAKVG